MSRLVAFSAMVLLSLAAYGDASQGTWAVKVTPEGGGPAFEDVLTFKGESFTSEALAKRGFEIGMVDADTRGRGLAVQFKVTQKGKEGTAMWQGAATAGAMEGTLTITSPAGEQARYTFKGERQ